MKNLKQETKDRLNNKLIIIFSLWLLAFMGLCLYIAAKTNILAFYIAAGVFAAINLTVNALFLSLRFYKVLHIAPKQEEKYNR